MSFGQLDAHPLGVGSNYPLNIVSPHDAPTLVIDRARGLGAHRISAAKVDQGSRIYGVKMKVDASKIIDITVGDQLNTCARHHAGLGRKLLGQGRSVRTAKLDVSYGVVFGVWNESRWQFFQQAVVELSYQHRDKVRSAWTERSGMAIVESCTRIA